MFVAAGVAGDFSDGDVFEGDVPHREAGVAEDAEGGVGFVDGDVAEVDAADRSEAFFVGGDEVAPLVEDVGLDAEDADAGAAGGDVFDVDVFHEAAAASVGFDEEDVLGFVVGRVFEAAVVDVDVADAAGEFAADRDELVAAFHDAAAHNDVFGGGGEAPAVAVAAGLDGDGVVALVEHAVLDEEVSCHFGIDTVVVVAVGGDVDAADDDAVAEVEVDGPERAVADFDVFDEDAAAAVELDELGAEIVFAGGHLAFGDGGVFGHHFVELLERGHVRGRAFVPLAPDIEAGEECAGAGEGDVVAVEGVDERGVVETLHAFPGGVDGGEVVAWVGGEFEDGAVGEVEVDVGAEVDGAGEPASWGNDYAAAAGVVAGLDGAAEGGGRGGEGGALG